MHENQADMVIVDHAKKIAHPPGSYSWKFIEQSVKNGALEDGEKHLVERSTRTTSTNKKHRTPYTAADDRILTEWVTNAVRKGLSVSGNDIYRQLEENVCHQRPILV